MVCGLARRWVISRSVKNACSSGARLVIEAPASLSARLGRGGVGHELGGRGQIPVGVGRVGVPEVGRQHRHPRRDVEAVAIPAQQRVDRERVPQVVDARPDVLGPNARPGGDLPERMVHVARWQRPAAGQREEPRSTADAARCWALGRRVGTILSAYSRSTPVVVEWSGTSLGSRDLPRVMVSIPSSRSTSSMPSPRASPSRRPVAAISPNSTG